MPEKQRDNAATTVASTIFFLAAALWEIGYGDKEFSIQKDLGQIIPCDEKISANPYTF